jgi:Uma2 family endonuclease
VRLRDLYWRAGVTEYWLVDARQEMPQFQILRHAPEGYLPVAATDGWVSSTVFDRAFQLRRIGDPQGNPKYVLDARPAISPA